MPWLVIIGLLLLLRLLLGRLLRRWRARTAARELQLSPELQVGGMARCRTPCHAHSALGEGRPPTQLSAACCAAHLRCCRLPLCLQGSLAPAGCPSPPPGPVQAPPPAALLAAHEGPCPLSTFLQLVQQQVAALGLGARELSDSELASLARRAGFGDGRQPLPPPALRRFAAWFGGQLAVLQALGPAGVRL